MGESHSRVLIVDDDLSLLSLLDLTLSDAGYTVLRAANGRQALESFHSEHPDLVILDVGIPDMSGWDVCARMRETSSVPVIFLTVWSSPDERIKGLQLGADDFLGKPFDIAELLLRVQAVLRRLQPPSPLEVPDDLAYYDEHLLVDLRRKVVQLNGKNLRFSPQEYDLLAYFVQHLDEALSVRQLMLAVWKMDDPALEREYVKEYIRRLRKKIEPNPAAPYYLITVRGAGYRFCRH